MPNPSSAVPAARRPGCGANLALFGFSILASLVFLELALRFLEKRAGAGAPAADSAVAAATYDLTPIYVPSPTLGWTLRPDSLQRFRRRDFDTAVRSNALGFRGPEIGPRPPGIERWVVLGDSYGFGWGVEEDSTYAARLAVRLNAAAGESAGGRYEVVNAALPGFGTFQRL
ncbi:MAG TPA: hypothetical protein VNM87_05145, partial [Candidatus Udaeobacter sp.]|nr:hypothetical protein [Candidatus Udaeobacter sp.]